MVTKLLKWDKNIGNLQPMNYKIAKIKHKYANLRPMNVPKFMSAAHANLDMGGGGGKGG